MTIAQLTVIGSIAIALLMFAQAYLYKLVYDLSVQAKTRDQKIIEGIAETQSAIREDMKKYPTDARMKEHFANQNMHIERRLVALGYGHRATDVRPRENAQQ